jgi:hypothetical protein
MPTLTLNLADQAVNVDLGNLANNALQPGDFTLAADVFTAAVLGGPISALAGDFLEGDLTAGNNHQWKQTIDPQTSITFGVTPTLKCSLIVRKNGTVFPSSLPPVKSDPTTTKTITVPAGKAYVSIVLSVSLEVTAAGKFTNGTLGVSASIDAQDTFGLANHFLFDQTKPIRDAIIDAFSRFVLPFGTDVADLNSMQSGDIVESEFIGSLALSASLTEGFNGVLFGAFGTGGLSLSGSSPLGSVLASAKPTFKLGFSFEVDYTHTDAFRMLILRGDDIELLFFRRDTSDLKTKIDASATLNPGVKVDFTDQVPTLLNNAAQKLVSGIDSTVANAFTNGVSQLVTAATQPLTDATNDLNNVVPNLLKKLPTLSVDASATFETVTQHTVFGSFDFTPLADGTFNATAWKLAMGGDLQSALHQPGVQLGVGSYVEDSLTKSTTLSFSFFGLNAQTVEQYFNDVTLTYAGNGQFQYRLKTGIGATSDIFGHQKEADFYFLVNANLVQDGSVNSEDVTLNILRKDQNASDHSFSMGKTIALMLPSDGPAIAQVLADATKNHPNVAVTLTAQFAASAFSKIKATPFVGGKPQPLANQVDDQTNFGLFVQAVDDVAATSDRFPDILNDYVNVWAPVNENLIGSTPPDRTQTGALSNPQMAFSDVGNFSQFDDLDLEGFLSYLEDARRFMDLCADVQQLSVLAGDPATSKQFADLVSLVEQIGKSDATAFPLEFLNAVLLALVRRMNATPASLSAPSTADSNPFNINIVYS